MRLGVDAALVDGRLVTGDVAIDGGRIQAVGLDGVGRGIAVPGFVDLQVNGFAGVDFLGTDADGFTAAGEALLETGVTAYLPTLITSEEADLVPAIASVPEFAVKLMFGEMGEETLLSGQRVLPRRLGLLHDHRTVPLQHRPGHPGPPRSFHRGTRFGAGAGP